MSKYLSIFHIHRSSLATTPWFDAWRDCFLRIVYGGDHEFLKNYLACKLQYISINET